MLLGPALLGIALRMFSEAICVQLPNLLHSDTCAATMLFKIVMVEARLC